jgi:hypothetical protein
MTSSSPLKASHNSEKHEFQQPANAFDCRLGFDARQGRARHVWLYLILRLRAEIADSELDHWISCAPFFCFLEIFSGIGYSRCYALSRYAI